MDLAVAKVVSRLDEVLQGTVGWKPIREELAIEFESQPIDGLIGVSVHPSGWPKGSCIFCAFGPDGRVLFGSVFALHIEAAPGEPLLINFDVEDRGNRVILSPGVSVSEPAARIFKEALANVR